MTPYLLCNLFTLSKCIMDRSPATNKEYNITFKTKLAPKKKPITANNLISPAPNALHKNKGNKRIIGRIAPPKE